MVIENALDSENEVPSAPTHGSAKANPEYSKGKEKLKEKKISPIIPTAKSSRTRVPQSPRVAGINNSTGNTLLRQARILRQSSAIGKTKTCCYTAPHELITL